MALPRPSELFETNPVQQFELLKSAVNDVLAEHDEWKAQGGVEFVQQKGVVKTGRAGVIDAMYKAGLSPDLVKEWELGSPIPQTAVQYTGITPYNYEPVVLMLVPKELKLRNSTARVKGIGQGLEYRRITGVSNSTSANVLSPFFSSVSNTVTINGVTLNRPPLISYTGDTTFKPYVEMGFTDAVSVQQQFAAQGFTDARALSHLSLIWAHVLGEERALLNSVATTLSITSFAATVAADSTATSAGLPSGTATAVYITASTALGESQAITASGTPVVSAVIGVKATTLTSVPTGTLALNFYVNMSGTYYKGTTPYTVTGAVGTGASPLKFATVTALPSTSADNGSGNTAAYTGLISEINNTALGGYQLALNGALSQADPGVEFETALTTLYISQGADPDVIWTTGSITQQLYDNIKTQGTATSYRLSLVAGDGGSRIGGAVTGITNPSTSKQLEISNHRYMPEGVAVIHSTSVPWADSGVTATMKVSNVVDTMVIDWPQIGMSYDQSTYTYGTVVFEAPILDGIITNIGDPSDE
jgi:hypothetical protein